MNFEIFEYDSYSGKSYTVKTVGSADELRNYFNQNSSGWPMGILPTNYWWLDFRMVKK